MLEGKQAKFRKNVLRIPRNAPGRLSLRLRGTAGEERFCAEI